MNTSSTYSKLLLDPAWKEKREYILRTQWRECNRCGSNSRLQFHHRYYRAGALPWEYTEECFEVLCRTCHRIEHRESCYELRARTFDTVFGDADELLGEQERNYTRELLN